MGFCTFYGFVHGDVKKLLAPLDGNNHFCGIDNGVGYNYTDYPLAYIGNLKNAVTGSTFGGIAEVADTFVCVKSCPKTRDG